MYTFTQNPQGIHYLQKQVTLVLEQMFMLKNQPNKPPQTNKKPPQQIKPQTNYQTLNSSSFFSPFYLTSHTSIP